MISDKETYDSFAKFNGGYKELRWDDEHKYYYIDTADKTRDIAEDRGKKRNQPTAEQKDDIDEMFDNIEMDMQEQSFDKVETDKIDNVMTMEELERLCSEPAEEQKEPGTSIITVSRHDETVDERYDRVTNDFVNVVLDKIRTEFDNKNWTGVAKQIKLLNTLNDVNNREDSEWTLDSQTD
jgi:hypothetical protein